MKSLTLNVPRAGLFLNLKASGNSDAQIVLVAPDDVTISEVSQVSAEVAAPRSRQPDLCQRPVTSIATENGFPPRQLTKQAIIQIIREHNGSVKIRDQASGWNIYDEIAARLGVSIDARRRLTAGTGEPAWRPEVGFARKDLEQAGVVQSTAESGWGIWSLKTKKS